MTITFKMQKKKKTLENKKYNNKCKEFYADVNKKILKIIYICTRILII